MAMHTQNLQADPHASLLVTQPDAGGIRILSSSSYRGPSLDRLAAASPPFLLCPAIANAIFDAVGVRLREVPFTPKRVLSALQGGTLSSKRL